MITENLFFDEGQEGDFAADIIDQLNVRRSGEKLIERLGVGGWGELRGLEVPSPPPPPPPPSLDKTLCQTLERWPGCTANFSWHDLILGVQAIVPHTPLSSSATLLGSLVFKFCCKDSTKPCTVAQDNLLM